jgi:3-deoxy-D-manno-octulosonic-acid transferase
MTLFRFVAFVSSTGYRLLEIFDAFIIFSKKLNHSLYFRRHWRHHFLKSQRKAKIWIHGASVGELEDLANFFLDDHYLNQAGLKKSDLMITSSSISASTKLEVWNKKYNFAYAGPIPPEKSKECEDFLKALSPQMLLLSHSDIWPQLYCEAKKQLPSGLFWIPQKHSPHSLLKKLCLFPWLNSYLKRSMQWPDVLEAKDNFYIGNPRIDRILARIENKKNKSESHILEAFGAQPKPDHINLILASAWYEDVKILSQALVDFDYLKKYFIVIIPHDPQNAHEVARMKQILPSANFILEEGILLESYESFNLAFVGGAFRTGLHNIAEPTLWSIPTICGPQTHKQSEAAQLQKLGQLRVVSTPKDLQNILKNFASDSSFTNQWKKSSELARVELQQHQGATLRLALYLKSKIS